MSAFTAGPRRRPALRRPPRPPARAALAAALIAWGVGEALTLDGSWPVAARIAFLVAVLAPIAAIDRWPWAVVAVLLAGVAVHLSCDVVVLSVTPLQGIVVAGWVAGAAVPSRWPSVAALAAVSAASLLATGTLAPFGVALACAVGWAGARAVLAVRRRHARAVAVLRSVRGDGARLRAAEIGAERLRLARELDAAVLRAARRIGDDARRAQALLRADPDGARALLREIAGATRAAMDQMRRALAVLRADEHDDAAPRPDGLEAAIALLRSGGVPVGLRDGADAPEAAATLAAARALEVLAGSAWRPERVEVRRNRHGARVLVHARGEATAQERLALTRIAERARLHGGTMRVRRRPRPGARRARFVDVRLPALGVVARRGPGAAGCVAGLLAAAATVADLLTGYSVPVAPADEPGALGIAVCAVVTAVAVTAAWTRRTAALVVLAAATCARGVPVGFVGLDATTLPLLALTAFLTPLWLRDVRQRAAVAMTLTAAVAVIMAVSWSQPLAFSDVAIAVASCVIPWLLAVAVRDAADEADRLTVLRWATAREDLVAAQEAVDDERRRVARDLHDLVGHGLSLVSVQAWGAERALPADRRGAAEGLAAIRRVLAGAVAELERLVAPWGEDPAAALPEVEALVAEACRVGLPVVLEACADGRPASAAEVLAPAPAPAQVAARRIVQEALTNALRHAGAAAETTVALRRDARSLAIEVRNEPARAAADPAARTTSARLVAPAAGGPATRAAAARLIPPAAGGLAARAAVTRAASAGPEPASAGVGLAGMRERVAALGGSFDAGPDSAGGFAVHAVLPLPTPQRHRPAPRSGPSAGGEPGAPDE